MALTIKDLVNEGKLHPLCTEIFRADGGESIRLYLHHGLPDLFLCWHVRRLII
jgi:hypothetical protein